MMRKLIAVCFVVLMFVGSAHSIEGPTLIWHNLERHYASFDEIQPMLSNNADTSIFLNAREPFAFAQLERWSETLGKFEDGRWKVMQAAAPMRSTEIAAHSEQQIRVDWQISTDGAQPKHFIVDKTGQERPVAGRYRLVLRYLPEPWTVDFHRKPAYFAISGAFTVGD